MENASKALLIAGAVLIVIVLISVGMMIVQQSQGLLGDVGDVTSNQSVTAFNTPYENYQGTQKGASIRTLMGNVSTNNSTNASGHVITIKLKLTADGQEEELTTSTDITKKAAEIIASARYSVVATNKDAEGYITEISITRK